MALRAVAALLLAGVLAAPALFLTGLSGPLPLFPVPPLAAQEADRAVSAETPFESAGTGAIMGRVADALRDDPMAGLEVRVAETELSARTDRTGEFVLWEVPAGTRQLRVTLPPVPGLGALTLGSEVRVEPGRVSEVVFERPGPAAHRDLLCGAPGEAAEAGPGEEGAGAADGAMVGRITDPGSGEPVQGAGVAFSWRGSEEGGLASLLGAAARTAENRYAVETDSAGRFAACGVPLGRPVELQAGETVRTVSLSAGRPFRWLELSAGGAAGARVTARRDADVSSVVGHVLSAEDDRPLVGARVRLLGAGEDEREVATRRGGFFRLAPVEPGPHRLEISRVGSGSDTVFVLVDPGAVTVLRLAMKMDPVQLPELTATVEGTHRRTDIREFYRRMERGNGRFLTGEEVDRHGWIGAFRRVPSVRLVPCLGLYSTCYDLDVARGGSQFLSDPQECKPDVYVDGTRVSNSFPGEALDFLRTYPRNLVVGIEVHEPSTVPPQYGGVGGACGVVLVWTGRR